jgi:hypothetical protein
MAEALEVDGRAPAHGQIASKQLLQRNDYLFPAKLAKWAFVGAANRLKQPAGRDILAAQSC